MNYFWLMSINIISSLIQTLAATFKGIIWRVETDDKLPIIAIESRDISNRNTSFSAFNYQTGECLFKEISVPDSWFWSLDRISNATVLLHSFVNEGSPEHKGIVAIDSAGEIIWQHYNKTLYDVAENGLVIYDPKIQQRRLDLIELGKGSTLANGIVNYNPVIRNIYVPDIKETSFISQSTLPQNLAGPLYSLTINNKEILAYHTQMENLYTQQLNVLENGEMVHQDYLAVNIQKMNPEAFFIERNHLFYIRADKQQIVSYLV
jgi:hypothetical protein